MEMKVVNASVRRADLTGMAGRQFGDMIKAVVDISREVMAIGGEMHADEEAYLLDQGSRQEDLWGINLYPAAEAADLVEFDSMINLRPSAGNRTRGVDDPALREKILQIVRNLVKD